MAVEIKPLASFSLTAGAAIEAGDALSIDTDGTVVPLVTSVAAFVGVAKFAAAAGEAVTVQWGLVNVNVNATGDAGDGLTASADAGRLDDVGGTTDPLVGYALETWTADATIRAFIYPTFARLAIA
jgi:hypothetical protein